LLIICFIIDCINIIGNDSLCYSFSIVSSGLFLIADFCYEYKEDLKPLLNSNIIKNMIMKIESDTKEGKEERIITGLEWAKKCINIALMLNQ